MNSHNSSYFVNSRRASIAQRSYCIANPGQKVGYSSNVWGLTACDGPNQTINGTAYAGIVKSEDDNNLVLNSPEDGIVTIKKADIQSRNLGLSAMPDGMATLLGKKDFRDLMEFLATQK